MAALMAAVAGCGSSGASSVCPGQLPCVHFVTDPGVGGNGAGDGTTAGDLASAPALDLGAAHAADQSVAPGDLATAAADLAGACVATGGSCATHNDAVCCSHYCVYATNTCK
ncbi:MAG TPA: hypothetical protein VHB97_07850 [Polyangia bacterium]|nr:hypothetical protein [Polyangia bacterium]